MSFKKQINILNGNIPTANLSSAEAAEIDLLMDDGYVFSTQASDAAVIQGTGVGCEAFSGQPSGCFFDGTNARNVFYSVLLER